MDPCELKEKYMVSLGPIPFLRDYLCTFNTTCYNQTQINWKEENTQEFLTFLNNCTRIYNNYPKRNLNLTEFIQWLELHPEEREMTSYSLIYFNGKMNYITESVNLINSDNSFNISKGIDMMSTIICGSNKNDASIFIGNFNFLSRSKRSLPSCLEIYEKYFSKNYFTRLLFEITAPIIFGKIYFTPDSEFTRQIIKKANLTFEILDNLRLSAVEWRLNFRNWLNDQVNKNEAINNLSNNAKICMDAKQNNYQICQLIYQSFDKGQIQESIKTITKIFEIIEKGLNCTELNKFQPMKSKIDIDNLAQNQLINIFAGVVFNESFQYLTAKNATFLNYQIRMPTNRIDSTKNFKVLDTFWTPIPRRNTIYDFKYYTSGFLFLQEAFDQAFIELINGNFQINIGSSMQIMPYPCYVDDRFIKFLSIIMPFILIIAWTPSVTIIIKSIVYEKENRLKEYMRLMGLTNFVHWCSWFISTIIVLIFPVIFMTFILKYSEIIQFSSPGIIFILILSYVISFICQSFMISTFFDNSNVASIVGGIVYFIFYLPFLIFVNFQDELSTGIYYVVGLLTQVSFCNAINFIGFWEQSTDGVQFSTLFDSTVIDLNFGVGHCLVMMWIDSILYFSIAWYVETVFPGKYGVPKPWYFLFTKLYWKPHFYKNNFNEMSDIFRQCENNIDMDNFEKEPIDLQVGILIKDLVKFYPKSKTPAVDKLSVKFFQSQITGFLGHNGAGKTTAISILTGILTPTSGTAFILGYDIRHEMEIIREQMGLCPQHNIFFSHLTVEDHIYFYGLLKGMAQSEIKQQLLSIVEEVGLSKKLTTMSKNLSGGMKRKLSIAMAFVGNSRIVFLDEPTAGVDPFSRRGIWDLIIKYRNISRTIILTTHHMDEADYLSDRIAIISQGKLKCCGSSLFLKQKFGDGYYLFLEKNIAIQCEGFQSDKISESGVRLLEFIQKIIPDSKLIEETMTQWTIVLPYNSQNRNQFSTLFKKLDNSLKMLKIASYGLSDTSLEEVFLNVADDPSKTSHKRQEKQITSEILETLTDNGNLPRPVSVLSFREKKIYSKVGNEPKLSFEFENDLVLLTGLSLVLQQISGLIIKRFHHTKRNIKGFFSEIILPLLLILLICGLLKIKSSMENQPSMTISPWLMMPKTRLVNLNTFYRKESTSDIMGFKLREHYRSDIGQSATRCMNSSIYQLDNFKCSLSNNENNKWTKISSNEIPLVSPECDCRTTGNQICSNPLSGGPESSYRIMASSDKLYDLSGYNISDYLMKNFKKFIMKQYGGFQFILPSFFGQSCKLISESSVWYDLRQSINSSSHNNSNVNLFKFLDYFQSFFNSSGIKTNLTRIWINSKGYISMTAYANIFSNLLLRSSLNDSTEYSNYGITVANYPLKYTQSDLISFIYTQMFLEVSLAIFVIFGLSFIPASFVIFLIEERVTGSKQQQYVSGVNPYVYWISNFCWDVMKYLISVLLVILFLVALNYPSYIGSKNVLAFILLLLLYCLAVIPHMYPFSFCISKSSTAFVVISAYNLLVGGVTTITTFYLDLYQYDDASLKLVNDALKKVFLVFPQYNLGRGMMDLSFNYLRYNISNGDEEYNAFEWNTTGNKLCSLGILFVVWCFVILIIESGYINALCVKCKNIELKASEVINDEDFDVTKERERIEKKENNEDVLKVMGLTKIYNPSINHKKKYFGKAINNALSGEKRKLAVNNISFGVKDGECFGLLGVNGAGKTTTFKMLIGEENITSGNAFINGFSIIDETLKAHKNMGFCPQFDALHSLLTCEEELYFYNRIRGVKSSQISKNVNLSMKNLSLTPHANKQTFMLSGGNKRKISTAIALIGYPKILFLDEPTCGMDAGARRFLWRIIQKLTNENKIAVILTSHNMEECEVLCHRLTIMVNGQMKSIGSVQHLKSKFGNDYYVSMRFHSDQNKIHNREEIKRIIDKEMKSNVMTKDENSVMIEYRFDSSSKLSEIFRVFENLKTKGIIKEYSISQMSLDEVFINFAKTDSDNKIINIETSDNPYLKFIDNGHDNSGFDNTRV